MASAGTPYRLVPAAHFYPCSSLIYLPSTCLPVWVLLRCGRLQQLLRLHLAPPGRIRRGRAAVVPRGHTLERQRRRRAGTRRQTERDGAEPGPQRSQHDARWLHRIDIWIDRLTVLNIRPTNRRPPTKPFIFFIGNDRCLRDYDLVVAHC